MLLLRSYPSRDSCVRLQSPIAARPAKAHLYPLATPLEIASNEPAEAGGRLTKIGDAPMRINIGAGALHVEI